MQVLIEQGKTVPTRVFSVIHRGIGITQEGRRPSVISCDHDADTRSHGQISAGARNRYLYECQYSPGCAHCVRGATDIGNNEDEFVTTEPSRRLAGSETVSEAPPHLLEHDVTRVVPQTVVHDLESVEIKKEHR